MSTPIEWMAPFRLQPHMRPRRTDQSCTTLIGTDLDENCACTTLVATALMSAMPMKTLVKRQSATNRLTARMTVPRMQHAHNSLQRTHGRRCWFLPACVVNPFETGTAPERRSLCNWREPPVTPAVVGDFRAPCVTRADDAARARSGPHRLRNLQRSTALPCHIPEGEPQ